MEFNLLHSRLPQPVLPEGYRWLSWEPSLLPRHATVKFQSFQSEIDSRIFPCLGGFDGCRRLMQEITKQKKFLPQTTWLISHEADDSIFGDDCGTIQGVAQTSTTGAIQNVGIIPDHRGFGLGRALVLKALSGFRDARLRRVFLEVTAENLPAVELYRSIGFRLARTMYKAVSAELAHVS